MQTNLKIKSAIDTDLVDRAEEEACQILLSQRLAFNARYYSRPLLVKTMPVLRVLGLGLSLAGAVLIIAVIAKPGWCPAWVHSWLYLLFFLLAGLLFYYFPAVEQTIKNWVKHRSYKGSKKLAKKCVKAARKAAPFQAEYEIKGDLISYYRGQDENWSLAWSRKARGVAIHGKAVTIFFRKWTSIQPVMVVLHRDFSVFEKVLTELDIEYRSITDK